MPAASMILPISGPTTATPPTEVGAISLAGATAFGALVDASTAAAVDMRASTGPALTDTMTSPEIGPGQSFSPSPIALEAQEEVAPEPQPSTGEVKPSIASAQPEVETTEGQMVPLSQEPTIVETGEETGDASPVSGEQAERRKPDATQPQAQQVAPLAMSIEKPIGKARESKETRLADEEAALPAPPSAAMIQQVAPPSPIQAAVAPVVQPALAGGDAQPQQGAPTDADKVIPTRSARAKTPAVAAITAKVDTPNQATDTRMAGQDANSPPASASDKAQGGLSPPLLTQTLAPVASRPAANPYPAMAQAVASSPVVQAQPGRLGADIGVQIAKAAKADRDDLLIRLDPREMGRIDVRLSFDRDGTLRAIMSADSPTALEMLRRESADLNRALADAGIRSDTQSLRFDTRSGHQGQGNGPNWQRGQQYGGGGSRAPGDGTADFAEPHYRPLRASGQVDFMA